MDRTFVRNLKQIRSLHGRQRSSELNVSFDPIKHSLLGFTLGAIRCVDPRVPQIDRNALKRPSFPSSVHPNGHGQNADQETVG